MSATEANGWTIFGPHIRGRACGACKLCCVLIPVDLDDGRKPHNTRCKHLRAKGCGIYERRPVPCRVWSCRWLMDPSTAGLRRPDLSGYAIDPVTDVILNGDQPIEVIQVWCDPGRPDAHRDPALRAWLALMAEQFGYLAIVRRGRGDGLILAPPAHNETGEWLELPGHMNSDHDMKAKLDALGAERFW
jgi:Pyruvate/2-oxoacid:ferredoxin oxidoreductase delta subunit